MPLRLHCFQHSPTEGLGEIGRWALGRGHTVSTTRFDLGERPPNADAFDWLVLMGGPMNIYEHRNHSWLVEEKQVLQRALEAGKSVLGVCLGAQLIADALGAKVFQNADIEIGWFPVHFDAAALKQSRLFAGFPEELTAFHWHGDTFSEPPGAVNVGRSAGCRHQAFARGDKVVGLQFHIEVGLDEVKAFLEGEGEELGKGRFIQTKSEILVKAAVSLPKAQTALEALLAAMEAAADR